jgi:hypothetical protein
LIFAGLAISRILYPYDVGEYEANAWAPASLLAHFHNPYSQDLAVHAPFVASPYGPVYYAIVGLGLRLFGDQFWFARFVALAAGLLSAWLVFRIALRFAHDRFTALLGSALLLAQYPMLSWAGVQRPDLMALAFVLIGLNFALRPEGEAERTWYPVWSALALVAAALSRQTYVIPFAVVAVWYLLQSDHHSLLRFAATTLVVGGGIMGALWFTSDGGFVTNLITNQARAPSVLAELTGHLRTLAQSPVTWMTAILLICVMVAATRRATGRPTNQERRSELLRQRLTRLLFAYFCLATGLAALSGSRYGSNINYFIEPLAIASLLVGVAGSDALLLTSRSRRIAALSVLVAGVVFIAAREGHGQLLQWQAKPYFDEIVADVRKIPPSAGPMYSDYPELIDGAGRVSYVNDFVQYDGRSSALRTAFNRLLASGKLAAIINASPTAPQGYVQVKLRELRPTGVYYVYLYVRRRIAATTFGTSR